MAEQSTRFHGPETEEAFLADRQRFWGGSIIFTHNMEIALIHPPVGLNLYVLSTISDAPVGEVIRGILPFLILLLIAMGVFLL